MGRLALLLATTVALLHLAASHDHMMYPEGKMVGSAGGHVCFETRRANSETGVPSREQQLCLDDDGSSNEPFNEDPSLMDAEAYDRFREYEAKLHEKHVAELRAKQSRKADTRDESVAQ